MPKRFRRTTTRVPGVRVTGDLVDRHFVAAAPNELWCADIKYVRTLATLALPRRRDGSLQPPVRRLADATRLEAELVVDALDMTIARRRPQPGLVDHSALANAKAP
ncbi:MAG: hypothetical protein ACRDLR_02015 [Gaiellaceae bacterium]